VSIEIFTFISQMSLLNYNIIRRCRLQDLIFHLCCIPFPRPEESKSICYRTLTALVENSIGTVPIT